MPIFRRKSEEIEAEKFLPNYWELHAPEKFKKYKISKHILSKSGWVMESFENYQKIKHDIYFGDWIVTEIPNQQYYPLRPEIFTQIYEEMK